MTSQNSRQWDLSRFVKTLSYFGAIPFLSRVDWFQQWFGSRPDPKIDSRTIAYANSAASSDASSPSPPTASLPTAATIPIDPELGGVILVAGATSRVGQQVVHHLIAQGRSFRSVDLATPLAADTMEQVTGVICCGDAPTLSNPAILSELIQAANGLGMTHQPIFNFAQPSSDRGDMGDMSDIKEIWGALDDVVMGGVSESSLRLGDGAAYFSGVVSTANSGGFASVRTRNLEPPLDLAAYDGIELRVKGDGNRYKFMVRTETRWDGVAHSYSFDTVADRWITVRISFRDLIPVFRARTLENNPLNPSRVYAWQLMLSKFEYDGGLNPHFAPGFFQIQIESIQVYRQSRRPQFILVSPPAEAALSLKNSGIAYTIVYPGQITDDSTGGTLRVGRQPLEGSVRAETVAELCLAALAHAEAQNATLYVVEERDSQEIGDGRAIAQRNWSRLFAGAAALP